MYLKDNIIGPESLAIKGDRLFSGLADGRIVEIDKNKLDKIKTIVKQFSDKSDCGE